MAKGGARACSALIMSRGSKSGRWKRALVGSSAESWPGFDELEEDSNHFQTTRRAYRRLGKRRFRRAQGINQMEIDRSAWWRQHGTKKRTRSPLASENVCIALQAKWSVEKKRKGMPKSFGCPACVYCKGGRHMAHMIGECLVHHWNEWSGQD